MSCFDFVDIREVEIHFENELESKFFPGVLVLALEAAHYYFIRLDLSRGTRTKQNGGRCNCSSYVSVRRVLPTFEDCFEAKIRGT